MTQSVVEKTSIPEKTCRRQTDSPFGWITFACGSLILHLLAFWLISLHKLSASQSASDLAVPIEFIEISPQKFSPVQPQAKPKPKPKAVIPKPAKPILPQNSQPAANPSAVKPPVIVNDRDAIAFNNQKIEQKLAEQQRQQELLEQQQSSEQQRQLAEQLRQRQAQQEQLEAQLRQQETEQQQKLAEQLRQQEQADEQRQLQAQRQQEQADEQRQLQAQRQQEQADEQRQLQAQRQQEQADEQRRLQAQRQQEQADEQRRLAQQSKLEAEEQRQLATQQQQNPLDGEKIANAPINARGETPEQRAKAPQAPIPQSNQSGGILTASWNIETDTFFKGKPDNLAKPQKRVNSDIPLPPPQDGNLQLGDFLVWLTIDNQGNLLSIEVDKQIPLPQRSQYQEYAEKIFNGQKFIPASEDNGNKPDLSYLPIRINIQSSSD